MEARITIRDIAEKAKVHFTTVSMALRNSPKLPQQTRARIQAIAEEMGYRPDPVLGALNYYRHSRRSHSHQATLGWINNLASQQEIPRHPLLVNYLSGAMKRAEKLGFKIDQIFLREPGMSPERIHNILRSRNISGLLIAPQPNNAPEVNLKWEYFSAVKFGHSLQKPELHTIVSHQYHAMRTMLQELRKLGYRRIGVAIERELDFRANNNWQAAFWVDYHSQPEENRVEPFFFSSKEAKSQDAFKEWFHAHKPEVMGLVGVTFVEEIFSLGLKIPQQVGLAMCGTNNPGQYISAESFKKITSASRSKDSDNSPIISGVYEDRIKVGHMAVDLLVAMLARQETGIPEHPQYLLAEGVWLPGCTVLPQNPAGTKKTSAKKKVPAKKQTISKKQAASAKKPRRES